MNSSSRTEVAPDRKIRRKNAPPPANPCQYFIDLIYERCRIKMHEGKELLIRSRLEKHVRRLGLDSLDEYVDYLRGGAPEEEFTTVVDALTTNFTQFLREKDHFEFLVKTALPTVIKPGQMRFQVWSAACSSGEEPYTLAMYLSENYKVNEGWDWTVHATDISTKVLAVAQAGIYPEDRAEHVPVEWRRKYLDKGRGKSAGLIRIKPDLAKRVEFSQLNLIEPFEQRHSFEAIFCRNVMIYFDRSTQEILVNRLCAFLAVKGHLFTGHSESLNGLKIPLRFVQPSVYQKAG